MKNMTSTIKQFNFILLLFTVILITGCPNPNKLDFSDHMTNLVPSTGTLSPGFYPLIFGYDLTVPANVDSLTLTPTLDGENVSVTVNDVAVESGVASQIIDLNDIDGVIRVDVTSATVTYNYVITIVKIASENAFLSNLSLSQGQIMPEFEENSVSSTGYSVTVPYLSSSINLTATLADPAASLTINGVDQISGQASPDISLVEGDNAIEVLVTAENQVMTQTYQLNVTRRAEGDFAFSTYVKATNTDAGDLFGNSVALWGNTLVVGAPYEESNATGVDGDQTDNSASNTGAVYIYEKDSSDSWQFKSYLKPPENNIYTFGKKVAISSNIIAIVSYLSDVSHQVHIYRLDDFNNWVFAYTIEPPNINEPNNSYVYDVLLSNKTLVVGNRIDNDYTGAVYVYQLGITELIDSQLTQIRGSNTDSGDMFGSSIALSGNTLAIGAIFESSNATGINGDQLDNSALNSGAVYIFIYTEGAGWAQQAYIKAANTGERDRFGASISLSGDTLIVGAIYEDGKIESSGAAYIFTRDASNNWSQQAYLKPHNLESFTVFGYRTFISGNTAIVGSLHENSNSSGIDGAENNTGINPYSGAAYLFIKDDSGQWIQTHYIKSFNSDSGDQFSQAISGYGDNLVLSAHTERSAALFNEGGESDNSAKNAGAVYIYDNAPFSNHNLALSTSSGGSINNNSITAINIDTGLSLSDCTGNCNQLVTRGETIQLTPMVGSGEWEFVEWQGDEACLADTDTTGMISVPILAETFCTAVFREVDISLTISKDVDSTADGELLATNGADTVANCAMGCSSDTSAPLALDSTIQITATAEAGAFVAGWSGDAQCQANTSNLNTVTTVTMSSSKTCTALFNLQETKTLTLMVNATGTASGSISVLNLSTSTNLDDCSSDCSSQIIRSHSIQLSPVAADGLSEFIEWTGHEECTTNVNGAGVTTVRLDDDIDCTAVFAEIIVEDIILTVSKSVDSSADGLIQASYNGDIVVSCDEGCISNTSTAIISGATISLTATPESGASVTAWTGDAECQANASADNTTTNTTITASKTCTAQFDFPATHALSLGVLNSTNSTGSISAQNTDTSIDLADCSNDCTQQVISGQTVQLTPIAGNASEFSHWSGDAVCSQNVSTTGVTDVLMDADTLCIANFTEVVSTGLTLTLSKTTDNTSLDGSMSATIRFQDSPILACNEGCTSATSDAFTSGEEFDIFAYPQDSFGYVLEWTGDPQCAANASADKTSTWVLITTQAITCTAKFSASL